VGEILSQLTPSIFADGAKNVREKNTRSVQDTRIVFVTDNNFQRNVFVWCLHKWIGLRHGYMDRNNRVPVSDISYRHAEFTCRSSAINTLPELLCVFFKYSFRVHLILTLQPESWLIVFLLKLQRTVITKIFGKTFQISEVVVGYDAILFSLVSP